MPWRLILALILMSLMVVFIGFNLENSADVSFGFYTFSQVPIFISLFLSFLFGVIVSFPFILLGKHKTKKKLVSKQEEEKPEPAVLPEPKPKREKTGLFFRKKDEKPADTPQDTK